MSCVALNWIIHVSVCAVLSTHAHLPSLPIMPAHPVVAVAAVLDPVSLGKLITHAVGMATLGAHQRDEVQWTQVHLEILFEVVRHDIGAPGPITIPIVWVKSEEEMREEMVKEGKNSGVEDRGVERIRARKYRIKASEWIYCFYVNELIFAWVHLQPIYIATGHIIQHVVSSWNQFTSAALDDGEQQRNVLWGKIVWSTSSLCLSVFKPKWWLVWNK